MKFRKYTMDEMCKAFAKHGKTIRHKRTGAKVNVCGISEQMISYYVIGTGNQTRICYHNLLEKYTWPLGTPCGVEVTE